jgi:hypothetical protein
LGLNKKMVRFIAPYDGRKAAGEVARATSEEKKGQAGSLTYPEEKMGAAGRKAAREWRIESRDVKSEERASTARRAPTKMKNRSWKLRPR